ncbi:MAG: ATP phosphoribosyltransferase regulatory subunit [Candidatus Dormibacteria bacterium]|jgi:ATP phosphoribosyltransferase regulatory subunit
MSALQNPARGRAGGFADWIGAAAQRRRIVTEAFVDTFAAWGYEYLSTPLVEPLETVAAGVGGGLQAQLFRFMDADGSLLALVGERTVSVARVVSTQLQGAQSPLRLCYAGPVLFNRPPLGGRRREAMQAGCELIGHPGLSADAECIAVAAAALERAGVTGVQIDVGHADFVPSLLDSANLDAQSRSQVAGALRRRDLVAVEEALRGTEAGEAERELLLAFPTLRGGREILDMAGARISAARPHRVLAELAELWEVLDRHGITASVHLDLGAVRDWDYYTGPTFELFSADLGFPLGSGGRYDRLLAAFGTDLPATGFVLHVDRCCDALMRGSGQNAQAGALRLAYSARRAREAPALAARIREAGIAVALELEPTARHREEPVVEGMARLNDDGAVLWCYRGREGSGVEALLAAQAEGPR